MKKALIFLLIVGLLISHFHLFSAFRSPEESINAFNESPVDASLIDLKEEVFEILNSKCNACHRKQNPFKLFSLKNMDKNAPKIYQQVFIKQRMPKGDKVKLTDQESLTLKKWLKSQNIF